MILASLFLSLSLLSTDAEMTGADWKPYLDFIAPYTVELRKYNRNYEQLPSKYEALLKRLKKIRKDYDSKITLKGLSFLSIDRLAPVAGVKNGSIGFFMPQGAYMQCEFLALFRETSGKMRGEVIQMPSVGGDELIRPESAVLLGNRLVISGYHDWSCNYWHHAVRSYQRVGGQWKMVAQKISPFETCGASALRLTPDGKGFEPILIRSRTYPKHLNASHASSNLTHVEKWRFVDGKPRFDSMWQCDTPYNVLDRLYLAIKNLDRKEIQKRSLNETVYRRLVGLHAKSLSGEPDVRFSWGAERVIGVVNLGVIFNFGRHEGRWVVTRLSALGQ
jgi:hypothetical protein